MKAFIVELQNQPGSLATAAEALAQRGINIENASGVTCGTDGVLGILTNDEDGTRSAFDDQGISYREVELVSASLENKPGTLADAARRLADAGVNVELLIPTGMDAGKVSVAFGVNIPAAARSALGELAAVTM
ncbi:MAG: ACT domain-containing protein [Candidatus Limnocylindria bacterium]